MSLVAVIESPVAASGASIVDNIEEAIRLGTAALLGQQRQDGHFSFELEADATIPSEYVFLKHFIGQPDLESERKIAAYLRRTQASHGGWSLLDGGAFNMSATVKAYFALKIIGDPTGSPHMSRARDAVLAHGGAAYCNVFTRMTLALFGVVPWTAVPVMPIELMLAPTWFPIHVYRMSYWARDTLVPLMVLATLKPLARNPRRIGIEELFPVPASEITVWPKGPNQIGGWGTVFGILDKILRLAEPLFPKRVRARAIQKAVDFVRERLNGEDGIGAIFPPMVNAVMMFDVLGWPENHPEVVTARMAVEKLLIVKDDEAYCQPCLSPVWDTALSAHALMESGEDQFAAAERCLDWLRPLQILDFKGDWALQKPNVRPGGWAFQYNNAHYPDLDDTAVVVMAMDRAQSRSGDRRFDHAIARAKEWVIGLQSRNGGWAAFDADNTATYLNYIPFADHGALLDPPTADVTARVVSMLAQLGDSPQTSAPLRRGIGYLRREQAAEGGWFGRWGINFIYGTWSVLCALNAAGIGPDDPAVKRAIDWLIDIQNPDGGWGEDDSSYRLDYRAYAPAPSTASQTSWAILGLMAAGQIDHPAVAQGVAFLTTSQDTNGFWTETVFTGTGFPRVFYLRYHGYSKFFPVWAMARFHNLMAGNTKTVMLGM